MPIVFGQNLQGINQLNRCLCQFYRAIKYLHSVLCIRFEPNKLSEIVLACFDTILLMQFGMYFLRIKFGSNRI